MIYQFIKYLWNLSLPNWTKSPPLLYIIINKVSKGESESVRIVTRQPKFSKWISNIIITYIII